MNTQLQDLDTDIQKRVRFWLEGNFDQETKEEIGALLESDRSGLVDAFYTNLSFGTGGMRGLMGVGTNRMNKYTIRWATQGLANYLKKEDGANTSLKVAIGYDSRNNSRFFAEEAARVLAGNGIEVFIFSELRPTPLVSFACRYHRCNAAIMVTASHNPPQYNGYKVYWDDGAQVLPPHDTSIIDEVNRLNDPDQVQLASFSSPLIHQMGKEVDNAYLAAIKPLQLWPEMGKNEGSELKILYSSLHGTGITVIPSALMQFGYNDLYFVDDQIIPDGNFPTAPKPNPEEKAALQLGMDKLLEEDLDIFVATDPDCDRYGVVVNHHGKAVALTGNQTLAIGCEYVLQAYKAKNSLPKRAAFIKTIVSTELFRAIVEANGASCFDVLTGFKYIAEKIRLWEGEPDGYKFVFGGEESYGCLLGSVVRDKDGVIATCLMAEIALYAKRQGKTLVDLLDDLYMKYGVYTEYLESLAFEETKEGKEEMLRVMQRLRTQTPKKILQYPVKKVVDLLTSQDLPKSDVLIFELEDGSKIIIRPSGTEPKTKVYVLSYESSQKGNLDEVKKRANEKAVALAKALKQAVAEKS